MNSLDYLLQKLLLTFGAALLLFGQLVLPASAQVSEFHPDSRVFVTGIISEGTCPVLNIDSDSLTVSASAGALNLMSRRIQSQGEAAIEPMTTVALNANMLKISETCTSVAGRYAVLSFDSGLALITPYDGLLRNAATRNPAGNVFAQLGQISAQGTFLPVDLNRPHALNHALKKHLRPIDSAPSELMLLGVRYVSDPLIVALNTNQPGVVTPIESGVSPGNFRVHIPFLQKLN
jgi:hypothetical protein